MVNLSRAKDAASAVDRGFCQLNRGCYISGERGAELSIEANAAPLPEAPRCA